MNRQAKVLSLEINCCAECPYCQYDGYYSMSQDSGMDCHHPKSPGSGRIVNEGSYISIRNRTMENTIASGVPDWCPLDNKEASHESADV